MFELTQIPTISAFFLVCVYAVICFVLVCLWLCLDDCVNYWFVYIYCRYLFCCFLQIFTFGDRGRKALAYLPCPSVHRSQPLSLYTSTRLVVFVLHFCSSCLFTLRVLYFLLLSLTHSVITRHWRWRRRLVDVQNSNKKRTNKYFRSKDLSAFKFRVISASCIHFSPRRLYQIVVCVIFRICFGGLFEMLCKGNMKIIFITLRQR